MRTLILATLFLTAAAPVAAQPGPRPAEPPRGSGIPAELLDPRMIDGLGNMMGALTKAFLDLPVGELEAAIENRPVTPADRRRTVRSQSGMSEREIAADIEGAKGAVKSGGQAMARALPVIQEALNKAGEQIERATANLPQPGYPRR